MGREINFDANASHGLTPYVADWLSRVGFDFLNPNSIHRGGQRARALIEEARSRVAKLLNVSDDSRVVFTSGATESNNTALALPFSYRVSNSTENQLVVSTIEHPSILECAKALKARGVGVSEFPVLRDEGLDFSNLLAKVSDQTKLVSLMWVNNETGEILPLPEVVSALRLHNPHVLIHSDAVQALGKLQINFESSGIDLMSISGHKIGALAGVGALIVGRRVPYEPLLRGGVQELHHRAGTENVLGIVSFGLAAEEARVTFEQRTEAMNTCRQLIIESLTREFPEIVINTPLKRSVVNTLNLRVPHIRADDLVVALDQVGIMISSGAACASGKPEPSHVLRAQGLSDEQARESVRISLRGDCTPKEAEKFVREFVQAVSWMRLSNKRVIGG